MITEIDYMEYATDALAQAAYVSNEGGNLQCFSESTIKSQGSYSLKGIAAITDSANKTLTRTLSPTLDLSNRNVIKFDIRSSRTGSNIKLGIYEGANLRSEITPNIISANTWQRVNWYLSGVANADKDAIDKIVITITEATESNIFYIDNFYIAPRQKIMIV